MVYVAPLRSTIATLVMQPRPWHAGNAAALANVSRDRALAYLAQLTARGVLVLVDGRWDAGPAWPAFSGQRACSRPRVARIEIIETHTGRIRRKRGLADLIIARRMQQGLTQEELATEAGVSRRQVIRMELCQKDARPETIARVLRALGIK
jgi:AraC-like DNA-binding protein